MSLGYQVLERNVPAGRGEIDIVAQQGDRLVFVEVKSGKYDPDYPPRGRVNADKRRSLLDCGEVYIKRRRLGDVRYGFAVAEVIVDQRGRPQSFEIFEGLK